MIEKSYISEEEETDKEDEVAASLSEYLKSDDGFHAFPVQAEDDASEEIYDVTATPRRKHDLKSLLRGYLAQEQMDGDNRYFCNNCNQLQVRLPCSERGIPTSPVRGDR